MMRKSLMAAGTAVFVLALAGSAFAMGSMSMPSTTQTGSASMSMPMPAAKLDDKQVDTLFNTAFDGLRLTEDQAMKAHDMVFALTGPMDEMMKQIDAATGAEKDLKNQEMMLFMQKAQVELDTELDDMPAQILDALVFGEFPDARSYPTDKAQVARLQAAKSLRDALDDHVIIHHVTDHLAKMMPQMPGMTMSK